MKKISDYSELNSLIMKHLKKGVYTNCFISKEEFDMEIANSNLFYHLYDGGLLLFRKMDGFFKLNFYINDVTKDIDFDFNDIFVCEIVSAPKYDYIPIVELFEKKGMVQRLKRVRFVNENFNVSMDNFRVCKLNLKDYEKIIKLFNQNFDKYIGCIPSEQSLKLEISKGNIYGYKEDDELIGILHVTNMSGTSMIKHLAVDKMHRRKGIAKALVSQFLSEMSNGKTYVWTGMDNVAGQNTYLSLGYKLDGYVSCVLTNNV